MSSTSQNRRPAPEINLPTSPDAEEIVLGVLLSQQVTFADISRLLKREDFSTEAHRLIYDAIAAVVRSGEPIETGIVGMELDRRGQLGPTKEVTTEYLFGLAADLPKVVRWEAYAKVIAEMSARRSIIGECCTLIERAEAKEDPGTIAESAIGFYQTISRNGTHPEAPPAISQWPDDIGEEAYHGIAGAIVRAIGPHTEADPVALLAQTLGVMGTIFGRTGHYQAEGDKHHANEYLVIVGTTSKGRKGTSAGRVMNIARAVAMDFVEDRIIYGIGSGEALFDVFAKKAKDAEEADYRALVMESEFARLLAITNREGSTMSASIRNGWDSGTLENRTRKDTVKVKGAHLSVIGHITREELLRRLGDTEMANGFGNRFLWICARRSKVLPHGGGSFELDPRLIRQLGKALQFARKGGNRRFTFDATASELWEQVYPRLSEGGQGMLSMMTSRSEAHVVRLSLIYALLDAADAVIGVKHLRAALAIWDYCYASAKFIWGDTIGDPVADEILRALKASPDGLTRWDIMNHFSRKKKAEELDRAVGVLAERGLIRSVKEDDTGGRASTRYMIL